MPTIDRAPPAAALAELKAFLRIEDSREDALLSALLRAATETVEAMLGLVLFERELEEQLVVRRGTVLLAAEPARSLVQVRLVDPDGGRLLDAAEARLVTEAHGTGRVETSAVADGATLQVRYRAGMAGDWNWVPEVLRLSVIRAAAHFHAHRDSAEDPGIPPAVGRLLSGWRTRRLR